MKLAGWGLCQWEVHLFLGVRSQDLRDQIQLSVFNLQIELCLVASKPA